MNSQHLAACALSRRIAAVAIFNGPHLEYTKVLQLQSLPNLAEDSVSGLVAWVADHFNPASFVLLSVGSLQNRSHALTKAAIETAQRLGFSTWSIHLDELLSAFAEPPLRSRQQLREAVGLIWPVLNGRAAGRIVFDAVALGLYAQAERLLNSAIESGTSSNRRH